MPRYCNELWIASAAKDGESPTGVECLDPNLQPIAEEDQLVGKEESHRQAGEALLERVSLDRM